MSNRSESAVAETLGAIDILPTSNPEAWEIRLRPPIKAAQLRIVLGGLTLNEIEKSVKFGEVEEQAVGSLIHTVATPGSDLKSKNDLTDYYVQYGIMIDYRVSMDTPDSPKAEAKDPFYMPEEELLTYSLGPSSDVSSVIQQEPTTKPDLEDPFNMSEEELARRGMLEDLG